MTHFSQVTGQMKPISSFKKCEVDASTIWVGLVLLCNRVALKCRGKYWLNNCLFFFYNNCLLLGWLLCYNMHPISWLLLFPAVQECRHHRLEQMMQTVALTSLLLAQRNFICYQGLAILSLLYKKCGLPKRQSVTWVELVPFIHVQHQTKFGDCLLIGFEDTNGNK